MTKCACGKICKIEINIDTEGRMLYFVDKRDEETAMYLDKKNAREIIEKLEKI